MRPSKAADAVAPDQGRPRTRIPKKSHEDACGRAIFNGSTFASHDRTRNLRLYEPGQPLHGRLEIFRGVGGIPQQNPSPGERSHAVSGEGLDL